MAARRIEPGPEGRPGSSPGPVPAADAGAPDEARLLAASAKGDAAAYRMLVSRHLGSVLAVARRVLRDDAEAEDIAQEAMLRLWRSGGTLEIGAGGVGPWLRRVAANLSIDRIRAGRRTTVTDEIPEQPVAATQLDGLAESDVARRVDAALRALPERQRLALTLFHYDGLSQIEVGKALGVSDEAVESLLARARRALKQALKDDVRSLLSDDG